MNSPYETTIYIVDSDEVYTGHMERMLRKFGFSEIITFNSAVKALSALLERKVKNSIVIADSAACKKITFGDFISKLKERYKDIKIMVLSASERLSDKLSALSKGIRHYISKNSDDSVILDDVMKLIGEISINDIIKKTTTGIEQEWLSRIKNQV